MKTWKERIDEAFINGGFSEEDKRLSDNWTSCAISEREDIQKRTYKLVNIPIDHKLDDLGVRFTWAVIGNELEKAKDIYEKIQQRADELYKEGK